MRKSNVAENVFFKTLKTKTAKFSTPFNLQYISCSPVTKNILVSDGRLMKSVTLASKYDYLFDLNILTPHDICCQLEDQQKLSNWEQQDWQSLHVQRLNFDVISTCKLFFLQRNII